METLDKLKILTAAAKYDVACTSSGSKRGGKEGWGSAAGSVGNTHASGICHVFAGDGRCVSLLKILMTNVCVYDCKYCYNRKTNDVPRATFTPNEIADLTINFYKRNYIEGLFLSSAVYKSPDYTMEHMIEAIRLLREEHKFNGYIHAKAIPGADSALINRLGVLVDRMSVNIELPSEQGLKTFAPDKTKQAILKPMGEIKENIAQNKNELALYRHAPKFAPAGQATQMIIGATPDSDRQIITLSEALYDKYRLKRVFYSAYIPVGGHPDLPALNHPPLVREHRLYQADWLLRFYGFRADELLNEKVQNFHETLDPKCTWALTHLELFPLEINKADYNLLLRVPGIGVQSAQRIIAARKMGKLEFEHLRKIGVVLKRARYFILCNGKYFSGVNVNQHLIEQNMLFDAAYKPDKMPKIDNQISMTDEQLSLPSREDNIKCLTGEI